MTGVSAALSDADESVAGVFAGQIWGQGAFAAASFAATASVTVFLPDFEEIDFTQQWGYLLFGMAGLLAILSLAGKRLGCVFDRISPSGAWLIAIAVFILIWEFATAKSDMLPRPFFVSPQALFGVYLDDWRLLAECLGHSLLLLATGYAFGVAAGFVTGVALGWSKAVGYWGHPLLRLIGPLPATAWLPVAFFVFPSSWSAAVFLVALASGVPVAILTWSGVASVSGAYYDVARTLGANQRFLIAKIAIPAAAPSVFVGLFMGLCAAFAVLVIAEMMGVKAGLGWYMQWSQGWAAYGNMYAALLVLALMCSGLVTALFRLRSRLLSWQKGLLRW